ncbi:MAG: histone deacetylase family protein [Alphaproteobacteria bacterium]|nr:histone deacetylase family protein [Alphaproteobacteria bacterium]
MTTGLMTHGACFAHEPPPGHPESPRRLQAVLNGLRQCDLRKLTAARATREQLVRAHAPEMVDSVLGHSNEEAQDSGYARLDADTFMSAGSAEAALFAAGAVVGAVDAVVLGEVRNAFCAVRPPGHHAERATPMGFCLFNNVAVGALHARSVHGAERIAAIDFDVHHGNGTQDICSNDPDLFYASTHQMPLYPGTGYEIEGGVAGNVLNRPLNPGSGSREFRAAYKDSILPALEAFAPEFVFISAGFDAHQADPLANLNLSADDFGWVTAEICAVAARVCQGRVVSSLEGGYDLEALEESAAAHVGALIEA